MNSKFDDIYNVKYFIVILEGVVRIVGWLFEDFWNVNYISVELFYKIMKVEIDNKIWFIFVKSLVIVLNKFLLSMKDVKDEWDFEIEVIWCLV